MDRWAPRMRHALLALLAVLPSTSLDLVAQAAAPPPPSRESAAEDVTNVAVVIVEELLGEMSSTDFVGQVVRRPGHALGNLILLTPSATPIDLYRALVTLGESYAHLGNTVERAVLVPVARRRADRGQSEQDMTRMRTAAEAMERIRSGSQIHVEGFGPRSGVLYRTRMSHWTRAPESR